MLKKWVFSILTVLVLVDASAQGSGNSIYFNGTSYVDLGSSYRFLSFPLTFTYWIKRTDLSNTERIFSSNNGGTGYSGFHSQILPNGTLEVFYGDGDAFTIGDRRSTYSNNGQAFAEWIHCAYVVHSSSSASIYANGILLGTYTAGTGGTLYQNPNGTGAFGRLLTNLGWDYMIGYLDDFTIWNKALSATEIRNLVCRKTAPTKSQLIGYFDFDSQVSNQVFDGSPFGYTGTIVGGATTPVSGASIGDTSYYQYATGSSGSVSNFSTSLTNGQSISVIVNSPNTPGVQVYEVLSAPNSLAGLPVGANPSQYFGVFLARTDNNNKSFTLQVNNYNSSLQVFKRDGNDDNLWTPLIPSNISGSTASFSISNYKAEFLIDNQPACSLELGKDTVVCSPISFWLRDEFYHPNKTYQWSTGVNSDSIFITNPGTYYVQMDSLGCVKFDTIKIETGEVFSPVTQSRTICDGEDVTIQLPVIPNQTINWFDGSNALIRTFNTTGNYWVTRSAPCDTLTDTIKITVLACDTLPADTTTRIFIPNVFTPNNDGTNDWFAIQGVGIFQYHLLIYNRWGSKLFESNEINQWWNGTYQGNPVADGVYVYLISYRDVRGKYHELQGYVTVLR